MPMWVGPSNMTSFQHTYDWEPCQRNHWIPHHGIFSKFYFSRMLGNFQSEGKKYASFKKS
jgi:hypothetical protein